MRRYFVKSSSAQERTTENSKMDKKRLRFYFAWDKTSVESSNTKYFIRDTW